MTFNFSNMLSLHLACTGSNFLKVNSTTLQQRGADEQRYKEKGGCNREQEVKATHPEVVVLPVTSWSWSFLVIKRVKAGRRRKKEAKVVLSVSCILCSSRKH